MCSLSLITDLTTDTATQWLAGSVFAVDTLDRGTIHVPVGPSDTFAESIMLLRSVHYLKTYTLFGSGISHLIFSEHSSPWVTKVLESETADKGELILLSL